jgi:hypothetical protein
MLLLEARKLQPGALGCLSNLWEMLLGGIVRRSNTYSILRRGYFMTA